jgi:endoglucanase
VGGSNGGANAGAASSGDPLGGSNGGASAGATSTSGPSGGSNGGANAGATSTSGPSGGSNGGANAGAASTSDPSGGSNGGANAGAASTSSPTGGNASATGGNATGGISNSSGGSTSATGGSPDGGSSGASGSNAANPETTEPFTFGEPPAAANHFKKGINLGNRLEAPNEGDWGGSVLASDFPFIAARGFDHVRIPIRFSGHSLTSAPYTIDAPFFERVDAVLDQAATAGLAVIIDLHAYDEMASDPSGQRERFLALWSQIAARYEDQPDTVAFELLNEPNTQLDTVWNDIAAAAISAVRTTNPRRLLVVDTVFWADPSRLSLLTLPNDANLLVSIHLYEPKLFSFQGKSWMGDPYMTTGVTFPGPPAAPITPVQAALDESWAASWFDDYNTLPAQSNPSGPATVDAQVAYISAYKSASGRTVYNGEWGPQDGGDMTSRANLVQVVREKCEAQDIGWAIWEDPNNMKLLDSAAGTWVTPIIDALLP